MRYAILIDGKVKNIVKADADTAAANGWVEATGEYATIHQEPPEPEQESKLDVLVNTLIDKGVLKAGDADKIKAAK